ncbi:MAG: 16S rRNA (cytidine(1402)-2'-O)-methyltransferase [Syntrophomonadaceae bacterium]|mgnify:CR=1 FL=1|jgi:16S rRNA (cytidine1402-2'-O)-methyltransferase|nr:16S rRNA (cytidine(1402)-2'-O)-methyltransferase [Syntrophomonadaceae bacterium]
MGILYICATPIGNLEDVSIRLLKTLRRVDLIACEDTRHTIKLLNRYKIKQRLVSYHQHSRPEQEDYIIAELLRGKAVALVTDAGMPGISDPGVKLIQRAIDTGVKIEVVPGPSAAIAALSVSGMESEGFLFRGFLPARSGQRKTALQELAQVRYTLVLYEAPHRLLKTLEDMLEIWGDRELVVARELTKVHEEIIRGSILKAIQHFKENAPRGEICLVVAGFQPAGKSADLHAVSLEVDQLIRAGMAKKDAFIIKAREYGLKKSDLYKYYEHHLKR